LEPTKVDAERSTLDDVSPAVSAAVDVEGARHLEEQ
jgi:hypothetical protein